MVDLVPRPRPGHRSRDDAPTGGVASEDWAWLVAGVVRSIVGVLFIGMSALYLPPHIWTPITGGLGIVMVTNGTFGLWRLGQRTAAIKPITTVLMWMGPVLAFGLFGAAAILGPGSLGPSFADLAGPPPT